MIVEGKVLNTVQARARELAGDDSLNVALGSPGTASYDWESATITLDEGTVNQGGEKLDRVLTMLVSPHRQNLKVEERRSRKSEPSGHF